MKYVLLLMLSFICFDSQAQKPALDTAVFHKWEHVGGATISDDGLFVCYNEVDLSNAKSELVIQACEGNWTFRLKGASTAKFSSDSKFAFFTGAGDSLLELSLGSSNCKFIAKVSAYDIPMGSSSLIYKSSNKPRQITLHSVNNETTMVIENAESYLFSPQGKQLLLATQTDSSESSLFLINMKDGYRKQIWTGSSQQVVNYAFDKSGGNVAFMTEEKRDGVRRYTLRFYDKVSDSTVLLADDKSPGVDSNLRLAAQKPEFSEDGQFIYFSLTSQPESKLTGQTGTLVKIWSYLDAEPESVAAERRNRINTYIAVVNITSRKIIRIEQDNEIIVSHSNGVALVQRALGYYGFSENNWNSLSRFSFSLVFLKDGSRKLVKGQLINPEEYLTMSPDGKWIVYFDFDKKSYYSYKISTGSIRNITFGVTNRWTEVRDDHPEASLPTLPRNSSWLTNEDLILVEDSYDLWLLDPSGQKNPIDITNGYGRRHHLKFHPLDQTDLKKSFFSNHTSTLICKAINDRDQTWYFFSKDIKSIGDPILLSKGPYVYGGWGGHGNIPRPPDKARNSSRYLISRMSAVSAPNYFLSDDFRHFRQLSDIQPQRPYNWLTTEEIRWRTFDGTYSQGILYKPENFNPRQRYPIIFDYYETRSDELNLFITPIPSVARINIPWYVSQGYLVFVPDIHYKVGHPGESAYNCIVSAARFLARMSWVDGKHMGLQGHSFGGYETNYLVTHTSIFAAACSASGLSDLISFYGSNARGSWPMYAAERNQIRIGATLWKALDLYIKNSPILKADRVTTPLLMMHVKDDPVVPFSQTVEFFTALRRLSKTVYLLEYDGLGHVITEYQGSLDYTTRMNQFFDHYLKDAPAPAWMTDRIN